MKKKTIYMAIAIALLVLLAAVYLLSKDNKNSVNTDITQPESQNEIYVTDTEITNQLEVSNSHGIYVIRYVDDKYVVEGYENNSISQSDMKYLITVFSKLKAEKLVEENAADIAKYGFNDDNPFVRLGDSETVISIGSLTSDRKYRYVTCDDKNVYIVNASFCELALRDIKEFINRSVTTIAAKNVDYVHIVSQGKPEILIQPDNENTVIKDYVSTSGLSALLMVSPIKDAIVYPTNMQEYILSDLSAMAISSVEELNPRDLSKYGLDNPTTEITIKDGDNELNIKKGIAFDENSFYVTINDRPEIYTMTKDCFNLFENVNVMDFIQTFVSLHSRSRVDNIVFSTPNGSHKIELKSEGENTISTDSEGVKRDNRNDYIDSKLIDKETFGDFYEMLSGISFDSIEYNKSMSENTPVYTITYNLSDGTSDSSAMYEYNDNFCFMNSENNILLVNKQQLVQLEDKINELTK